MLAALLTAILHVMLTGSLIGFVTCIVLIALAADERVEQLIRFGALLSGGLVVLGAQVGGASFSELITEALSSSGVVVAAAGVAVPGALGAGLGYLFVSSAYHGNIYVIRIILFVGMLAATQFAQVYIDTLSNEGFGLGPAVVPNIAFVVGILLCIALTYDPKNPRQGRRMLHQLVTKGAGELPPDQRDAIGADPDRDG